MDTRRTIIAIVLSFAVMFGWQQLSYFMGWIPEPAPEAPQQMEQPAQAAPGEAQQPAPMIPLPTFTPAPGRDVVVETPLYRAVLHSGGGILRDFSLKKFHVSLDSTSPLVQMISPVAAAKAPMGIILDGHPSWSGTSWQLEGGDMNLAAGQTGTLTFVGDVNGTRLQRELTFNADKYSITEKLSIVSPGARNNARIAFTMNTGKLSADDNQYDTMRVAYYLDGSFKEEGSEKTLKAGVESKGQFSWASAMSNYFLAAVSPMDTNATLKVKLEDGAYRVAVEKDNMTLAAGQPATLAVSYFIGPKDQELLNAEPNDLGQALNYGMFSIVARPLLAILHFFYGLVGNYGVAIILLTIVVKAVLWPLSYKSYKSMEQMKKIQPMMAKLKEKHGDNKELLNQEMMQLYKTYKVNPASGCLPILVQLPVFIGLYQGLLGAVQLRHASFINYLPFTDWVWLADLSVKDPYYITPLVMGGTMFLQQYMTPSAGDPTQQKIMLLMPVVFTFMFINFPAGLVVYWLTNNVISIAQQWWQLRRA